MDSPHIGELVLSEQQIREGVRSVASALNQQFSEAVIVTVVPGGLFFTADLVRKLRFPLLMDFISCPHTPGDRNNNAEIVFHENIALENRDVILIDDAIESGGTMQKIAAYIQNQYRVHSLSIATLLVKPGRVDIPVKQYFAYEMADDELLVGYGLPWEDRLRNVPFIAKLVK